MIKNHKNFKTKFGLLVFLSLFSYSLAVQASQSPRFLGSEKKFRAYIYNPNDVYRYIGHYNYQGFIEFATDETISTISMGDSSLWLFKQLGNRLFLKPVADKSDTNMTVITNKKIYHFELVAKDAKSINDPDLIFVVKFVYPDEKDKNILEFPKVPVSDEPDMRNINIYNFNYEFTGEPSLAPIKVFDNGEFTYFQFNGRGSELPAIFSVDSAGFESLVNFRAAGDYIIVERIAPQFTLRNGNEIVCVYNNGLLKTGKVLPTGQKRPKAAEKDKNASPFSFDNATPFATVARAPRPNIANPPMAQQNYPSNPGLQNLNVAGASFPGGPQAEPYAPQSQFYPGGRNPAYTSGQNPGAFTAQPPFSTGPTQAPNAMNYGLPAAANFPNSPPNGLPYAQPSQVRQSGFVMPESFDMGNQNSNKSNQNSNFLQ